jgi:hypothetical protein
VSVGRTLLLAAIRGYKHHVSPRKGFSRAHRVHLDSCSWLYSRRTQDAAPRRRRRRGAPVAGPADDAPPGE